MITMHLTAYSNLKGSQTNIDFRSIMVTLPACSIIWDLDRSGIYLATDSYSFLTVQYSQVVYRFPITETFQEYR